MEIRFFDTVYEIDDRTKYGIHQKIQDTVAEDVQMETFMHNPNAWTNFEIALHAIDSGKELNVLLDYIRANVGIHIVGVWGIDDQNIDEQYILIAFEHGCGKTIEFRSYRGNIQECAKTFIINGYPTEEEMEEMYREYIANYGEILDTKYTNGAV